MTIGKNRLREDAINIVFGAHLGFDAKLKDRYTCVFLNLEQLGDGGAKVGKDYLHLLSSSAVMDYDVRNLAAYGCKDGDIPIVSFQYAPYLSGTPALPIKERPIDLLFFGSINERRKAIFQRIEACGWSVSRFDHPLYGEERDHFIRQSKAVFNCHFYESSRFEQARAFHTLSLGTPVISERTERTTPPQAFEETVSWVRDDELEDFFKNKFMKPAWIDTTQYQLRTFTAMDAMPTWTLALKYCMGVQNMKLAASDPWHPAKMSISFGIGDNYKLDWLNVGLRQKAHADILIDISMPMDLPLSMKTKTGTTVILHENQLSHIHTRRDLTRTDDSCILMGNLLRLLKPEGQLHMEIPCELLYDFIIEPAKINLTYWEKSIKRFWETDNLKYRFEIHSCTFVDTMSMPCDRQNATSVMVILKKIETSLRERTIARVFMTDFGETEDDDGIELVKQQRNLNPASLRTDTRDSWRQRQPLKFIFYTPHYDDNSGGLIAIYKLAHMLNENSHTAKIWHWTRLHKNEIRMINGKVSKEFAIPSKVSHIDVDCPYPIIEANEKDIQDSIVVYPEIIEGNPLGAKNVVRWLLNKPGAITGSTSYGFGDLIFYYAEHFLPNGLIADESFRLKITDMKKHIYKDNHEGERKGIYYMVRKGRDVPLTYHPDNAVQVDGKSHAELAKIFASAQMFISYDLHTAYSLFASLCGCDSVVVPRPGMSKEQWKVGKDESDLDGIAYGYEDIERARQTRPAMIARLQQAEVINLDEMNNFLNTCKQYFFSNQKMLTAARNKQHRLI